MRVLVVTGLTHWGQGGAQRETERLLSSLIANGVETGFVVDRPLGMAQLAEFQITEGRSFYQTLREAISAFQPDVVHMIGGGAKTIGATGLACKLAKRPWIATVHNVPPRERSGELWLGDNARHYAVRNAMSIPTIVTWWALFAAMGARVVVHSSYVFDLMRRLGVPKRRLSLIPFGLDTAAENEVADVTSDVALAPPGASPRILTVAALAHTKGVHDYIRILPELARDHPRLHFTWVGAERYPSYQDFVRSEIARLGLTSRVTIVINASEATRLAALHAADLYVQPSHEEGFCLTYIEAALIAPKLLGTRTGAMAEISADDPLMRVVPPGDGAALLRASQELLAQEPISPAGLAARKVRLDEQFSWTRYTEQHIALYRDVAAPLHG